MANYAISNVPRRVVYAASGTGPYAFTFEVLSASDIAVYKGDTLLTLTTDYSVTINANGTGSVTLTTSAGTSNITIVGSKGIQRTTDFTTGGDFFANTLNDELDAQTIFIQQVAETAERGLKAPVTDPTDINMTLPRKASRAGKTLAFDANGNPVVGEDIGNWRGNWASGTAFTVRDLVKDASNSNVYRCNTAHTSTGTTPISTNADSAKWDLVVDAAAAGNSATAAANSATAAAASASAASTSASNASTSATNAASSASAASTSASNASSSASTASTQATNAANSATAAASSASSASTSASNASTSATNAANSASAASTSASTATTQATNAANSASAASTSATNASNSASAASTSASNAATSATNASNSASAAATSATNAAASFDSFDDRYLGAKASNPTVDNDGNALLTGALYFNSVAMTMRVWNGSAWQDQAASPDTISERSFTATAGQTTYAFGGGYRIGYVYVWVNGVLLSDSDITATDGTNITFASALALNDEVRVMTFKAIGSVTIADISGLQTALDAKQATLVSGTNIKTINGSSLLGAGNITTGVTDGDKGDITVSGSGGIWTIDNDAVTFAKMQNVASQILLGRNTAASGDLEELSASVVRTILGLASVATSGSASDLTSGTLAKARMPSGSVVQTQYVSSGTRVSTTHTGFVEPSTAYRVSITPTATSSMILLRYFVPAQVNSSANILQSFRAFRIVGGGSKDYALTSRGNTNASRNPIAGMVLRPQNGFDLNDMLVYQADVVDFPNTTSSVVYGFETNPEGGNTTCFGYSANDNSSWGFDADIVIVAQEITQ